MKTLLLGGPGTGKTTTLVNRIIEYKPDNFSILTFTRQAAQEARSRLKIKGFKDRDVRYVRTIHSLAFELLRMQRGQVFSYKDMQGFGKEYGYQFSSKFKHEEDGTNEGLTEDDIIYRAYQIYRITEEFPIELEDQIFSMAKSYKKYKDDNHLLDFTDMLVNCLQARLPKFSFLCVDEIQDLSSIQHKIIEKIYNTARDTIFAGDDDQMIYEWSGVRKKDFDNIYKQSTVEILDKNYRIPVDIAHKSSNIIERCKQRIFKPIRYSTHLAEDIKEYYDIFDIDLDILRKNKTLILARNLYLLKDIKFILDEANLRWGYLKEEDKNPPNIRLSTIHGSKGAEADVVVLFDAVSPSTYENINRDSEHRVWYVGVTRTRKQLILIKGTSDLYYDV